MPIIELNNRLVDTDEIERERWKLREESIATMVFDDDPNDEASKWIDDENPEWTKEDFDNALTFEQMPPFLQEIVLESIEKNGVDRFLRRKK